MDTKFNMTTLFQTFQTKYRACLLQKISKLNKEPLFSQVTLGKLVKSAQFKSLTLEIQDSKTV